MIFVTVSTGHFDPLIAECAKLSSRFPFLGQIGSSTVVPPFEHYRTGPPSQIEADMGRAELVIAHAGTGMLSSLYRLRKKAIVIPKQKRYGEANDGQVELAKKWCALGLGLLCLDVEGIAHAIEACRGRTIEFPRQPSLGDYLRPLLPTVSPTTP